MRLEIVLPELCPAGERPRLELSAHICICIELKLALHTDKHIQMYMGADIDYCRNRITQTLSSGREASSLVRRAHGRRRDQNGTVAYFDCLSQLNRYF